MHEIGYAWMITVSGKIALISVAGVNSQSLIEAHGSFAHATCQGCTEHYTANEIKAEIFNGRVPLCKKCKVRIFEACSHAQMICHSLNTTGLSQYRNITCVNPRDLPSFFAANVNCPLGHFGKLLR